MVVFGEQWSDVKKGRKGLEGMTYTYTKLNQTITQLPFTRYCGRVMRKDALVPGAPNFGADRVDHCITPTCLSSFKHCKLWL